MIASRIYFLGGATISKNSPHISDWPLDHFGFTSLYFKRLCFLQYFNNRDDFDFDIVNFPFLDGDVPRRPSYGVYISQLIRFARVCSHVDDFHTYNKCLTT